MVRTGLGARYKEYGFYDGNDVAKYKRPSIEAKIRKGRADEWALFSKYHYLSGSLNKASNIYILEIYKEPIGFCAVIHFPHNKIKNLKKVHRLVIRPDYQGLGLGIRFLEKVALFYKDYDFRISTSNLALIYGLNKRKEKWKCTLYQIPHGNTGMKELNKTASTSKKIATFKYIYKN